MRTLFDSQAAFIDLPEREAIAYGNGGGKTTAVVVGAVECAAGRAGRHALLLRATQTDLRAPGSMLDTLRSWIGPVIGDTNGPKFRLHNGSTVICTTLNQLGLAASMTPENGWSYIGLDECHEVDDPTGEKYRELLDTLAPAGKLRVTTSRPTDLSVWLRDRFTDFDVHVVAAAPVRLSHWENPTIDSANYEAFLDLLPPVERSRMADATW